MPRNVGTRRRKARQGKSSKGSGGTLRPENCSRPYREYVKWLQETEEVRGQHGGKNAV